MMMLDDCRRFYADEVRLSANILSPALVEAFAHVPREKYLGPPPWQIGSAEQRALSLAGLGSLTYTATEDPRDVYHNVVIALDAARDINNGQPGALARWIDAHEAADTCIVHGSDVCVSSDELGASQPTSAT
jgi:protein-L-isoaspartate(D-aspartate) O-methyltransferase